MKVDEVMTRDPAACGPDDPMARAAGIMWERDCGVVPVVEPDTGRLLGMITDRDCCMAVLTRGAPLDVLPVRDAMATHVFACKSGASVTTAHALMREHQVRRLPVVDNQQRLVGIVSLNDLARHAAGPRRAGDVFKTLQAVCRPRNAPQAVRKRVRKTTRKVRTRAAVRRRG